MSSSGGPVRSVFQKRSATQVLSRRHLRRSRQHPASIKKVVSNVGNYVTLAARGD